GVGRGGGPGPRPRSVGRVGRPRPGPVGAQGLWGAPYPAATGRSMADYGTPLAAVRVSTPHPAPLIRPTQADEGDPSLSQGASTHPPGRDMTHDHQRPGAGTGVNDQVQTAQSTTGWQHQVFDLLRRHKVTQIAYVPDAGHKILIERSIADPGVHAVPLTTEEEGVALLAGADLGGERGVLLMQS